MSKLPISCILLLSVFIGEQYASPLDSASYSVDYFDKIIEEVKKSGAQWEAGHNFEDRENFEHLLGTLDQEEDIAAQPQEQPCIHTKGLTDEIVGHADAHVSRSFNGLKEWKNCRSVRRIWNQGRCASDWVIAPVSAFTDRLCIASNGTFKDIISPEMPLACCKTCGWGCSKGYPKEVNNYLAKHGAVTGAEYYSDKGCQPYSIRPSRHAKYFQRVRASTPKCEHKCTNPRYKKDFHKDLVKAKRSFSYTCPFCAASELKRHGPITATMKVYEDFFTYKTGIYHHVTGKPIGQLTVKLIGYNDEDPENKYWLAANSWGKSWGDNGRFKIRRGVDECMIDGSLQGVYVYSDADESSSSSSSEEE